MAQMPQNQQNSTANNAIDGDVVKPKGITTNGKANSHSTTS